MTNATPSKQVQVRIVSSQCHQTNPAYSTHFIAELLDDRFEPTNCPISAARFVGRQIAQFLGTAAHFLDCPIFGHCCPFLDCPIFGHCCPIFGHLCPFFGHFCPFCGQLIYRLYYTTGTGCIDSVDLLQTLDDCLLHPHSATNRINGNISTLCDSTGFKEGLGIFFICFNSRIISLTSYS